MIWALLLIGVFGMVVLFGAPYLPTLKRQQNIALDLLDLKAGQTLIELGSGDGRVLLAAAKRGLEVIGYEINPLLFLISLFITFKYRRQVKIILGNYWRADWSKADGLYVFLLAKYMKKLDKKITQSSSKKIKVVSYAFKIPNRPIIKQVNGLYLYQY